GTEKLNVSYIRILMSKLKLTAKQAMDMLEIPQKDQEKYLSML
ncbi:hypothetical protein SAMN02910369_02510, partial [Lachnospiraceae bacterium NE2001]